MRFRHLFHVVAAAVGVVAQEAAPQPRLPWITGTPTELFGSVEADGNSPERWMVADRASGLVRWIRLDGTNVGSFPVRASGLGRIETAAFVRSDGAFGAVAVGDPIDNRLAVVPHRPTSEVQPVFLDGVIGPSSLAAFQSRIAGEDPLASQLMVASSDNGSPTPLRLSLHGPRGSMLPWPAPPLSEPAQAGHAFRITRAGAESAGFLVGGRFLAWTAGDAGLESRPAVADVAAGSDWVADFFRPDGDFAGLVFFRRGSSTVDFRQLRRVGGEEPSASDPVGYDLGLPVEALLAGGLGTERWLLVLSGREARLFDFDGTNPPRTRQSFSSDGALSFTAAAIRPDGGLLLLEGESGRSSAWSLYPLQDGRHVLAARGTLAELPAGSRRGSQVFAFTADPVRNREARLIALGRASDWGTSVLEGARVLAETDRGSSAGLGDTTVVSPEIRNVAGGFLAVNQFSPLHSLFSYATPESVSASRIRFEPRPGRFSQPIQVAVAVDGLSSPTFFIQSGANPAWTQVSGPITVSNSLTLRAWARGTDGVATPVAFAEYRIQTADPLAPAQPVDLNGNGIPDEVERGLPTDGDQDADSYPDGEEWLAGSDPADPRSTPPGSGGGEPPVLVLLGIDIGPEPRIRLRLFGRAGVLHALQSAEVIAPGAWSDAAPAAVMPASGSMEFSLPMTDPAIRFFRGQSR